MDLLALRMARLLKTPPFVGTKDGIVVYKRGSNYYVRTKSTLSGKRVKKSAAFKNTMASARLLGNASKIASKIYQQLPKKQFKQFRKLTGIAMKNLKAGLTEEETLRKMGFQS
jgi:hypothetical protein